MPRPEVQRDPNVAHGGGSRRGGLLLRPMLLVLGAYHLVTGVGMGIAPRSFYDRIAGFPPYNGHFLRDVATFYVALGLVTLIAAGRRSWQVPVLALTLLQYGLHTINHLVDVGETDPGWHGPANAATLAVIGVLVFWVYGLAKERA